MGKDQQELLEGIRGRLSAILAIALLPEVGNRSMGEKVKFLAKFGLSNQEIAEIAGTTAGTVGVIKSVAKRKRK
jgi:hypothetical protein